MLKVTALLGLSCALVGCTHHEPPSLDAGPPNVAPLTIAPAPTTVVVAASSAASETASWDGGLAGESGGEDASAKSVPPSNVATIASAELGKNIDVDDGSLPQTHERPKGTSALLDSRAKALFDAIVEDRPEAGMAFFFPRSAYAQVKDVTNPERDWRFRLVSAYERDIHELHRTLGTALRDASFASLEVREGHGRWVEPGEEFNKIGYHRVFNTELRFRTRRGVSRVIPLKSLISWRGEWYVVHLSSVK